jgi:hypothetical protein
MTWLGPDTALGYNQVRTRSLPLTVPSDQPYSQPFWLVKPRTDSSYTVDRQEMRDRPDNPPYYTATFEIQAGAERIGVATAAAVPVCRSGARRRREAGGHRPGSGSESDRNRVRVSQQQAARVEIQVRANVAKAASEVRLEVDGWKAEPPSRMFRLSR